MYCSVVNGITPRNISIRPGSLRRPSLLSAMAPTNKINKEVVETSQKFKPAPYTFKYNFKDTILYNLAVGASTQEPEDLK